MASVTYTSRASLPITYQWKCSYCGAINRKKTMIYASAQTISSGKKVRAEFQEKASEMSKSVLQDRLSVLYGQRGSYYHYKGLGLNQECENCHQKEPWALNNDEGRTNFLIKLGIIILSICGICILFSSCILAGGDLTSAEKSNNISLIITLLIVSALILGFYFYRNKRIEIEAERRNKEIDALPATSLPVMVVNNAPVFSMDLLEALERYDKRHFNKDNSSTEQTEEITRNQANQERQSENKGGNEVSKQNDIKGLSPDYCIEYKKALEELARLRSYESFLEELRGDFASVEDLIDDTRIRMLSDKEHISYAESRKIILKRNADNPIHTDPNDPIVVNLRSALKTEQSDEFTLIKKYKDLFDCGILTEKEFQQKKEEILRL